MKKNVAWRGWINGKTFGKVLRIKVHLSKERKFAQVPSPKSCSQSKPTGKTWKNSEKQKAAKTRVSQTYPPQKNLVLEIWLLREPLETYRLKETCGLSGLLVTAQCSQGSIQDVVAQGVYFTQSIFLTGVFPFMYQILPCRLLSSCQLTSMIVYLPTG